MISLTLPWPPSGNHYKKPRVIGGHVTWYLTAEAKAYRTHVGLLVLTDPQKPPSGRLRVRVEISPPDKRKRDLDNAMKVLLDSLQAAGAIRDDADIDDLHVLRMPPTKGGAVRVTIEEIEA